MYINIKTFSNGNYLLDTKSTFYTPQFVNCKNTFEVLRVFAEIDSIQVNKDVIIRKEEIEYIEEESFFYVAGSKERNK